MLKNKKGFTLIELLVVIAIIGILASVVLASLNTARKKSRDARRVADIKQIQLALELYFDGNSGQYPTAISALAPTYIATMPTDPLASATAGLCRTLATGYCYGYRSDAGNAQIFYHLGARMEETGTAPLSSDRDCDSTDNTPVCAASATFTNGFDGSVDAAVSATTPIYDVTP